MKRKSLILLTTILFFCITIFSYDDYFEKKAKNHLEKCFELRGDVKALAYLSSFYELFPFYDDDVTISILDRIISSKDSHPLVVSMARNEKRYLFTLKGRFDEVKKLINEDSFILDYLIVAPFPNENKGGLKEIYNVENDLDFNKKYVGINENEITFRKLPKLEYSSNIPLDNFVDPSDKATAYLASFIYSDKDFDCVLRASFNGAFKVFVNGEDVFTCENYNTTNFDQYCFPIKISRGYNLLLIKSCNSSNYWQFRIRITDALGSPLKNIRVTNDLKKVTEDLKRILAKNGKPSEKFKYVDPHKELKTLSERGNVDDLFIYGLYLLGTQCFDEKEHLDLTVFKSILEKDKSLTEMNYFIAKSETDFNRRRDYYEKGSKTKDYEIESLYQLFRYYQNRNMPLKANEYINKLLELRPDNLLFKVEKLYLLKSATILEPMTYKEIEKLYEENKGNYTILRTLIDATDDSNFEKKERLLLNYKSKWFDRYVFDELFNLYQNFGKEDKAIAILKEYLDKFPYDRDFVYKLAKYEIRVGLFEEAEKILKDFLIFAPLWDKGYEALGEALIGMGKKEEALSNFQKSLTLNTQNDNLKRRIKFLKPDEEVEYLKYRVKDEDIPLPVEKYDSEPIQVLLYNTFVSVQNSGLSTRYVQYVAKVQSSYGAQILSSYPITYDPDWQEVRILEIYASRDNGTKLRGDSYTTTYLSDPTYQLYYRNRQMVLYFSGLKKGDVVHYEYLITDKLSSKEFGNYFGDIVPFKSYYPILNQTYILKVPTTFKIFYKMVNGDVEKSEVKTSENLIYVWSKKAIDPIKGEPYSPGFSEIFPYLHISTFESWEELGKWYSSFIKEQWELSEEAKDKVKELTRGKASLLEKVIAIHNFVEKNTRYVGLEFGEHGYKPYKASKIFERRFGDCKDKALLLCAMLKEANVDARMVLIRTKNLGEIEKSPVSLSTFNHCIAYIKELDLFLDGTAEFSGINELPYLDQGVDVLIIDSEGNVEVKRTKENNGEDNLFYARYFFDVKKDKEEVETEGLFKLTGVESSSIRQSFQNTEKQKETLEKQLSNNFPSTTIENAQFKGIDDLNADVEIHFTGKLKGVFQRSSSNSISAKIWIGKMELSSSYAPLSTRKFDIVIPYKTKQVYEITYRIKDGFSSFKIEEKEVNSKFGNFTRKFKINGNEITVISELTFLKSRIKVDEYKEFKDFVNKIDKIVSERIEIKW